MLENLTCFRLALHTYYWGLPFGVTHFSSFSTKNILFLPSYFMFLDVYTIYLFYLGKEL